MGFYGTATSSAKTNIQVDIIYPNKLTAKNNASKDGVYAGRYVLVEYDTKDTFFEVENPLYKYPGPGKTSIWSWTLDEDQPYNPPIMTPEPNKVYHVVPIEDINNYKKDKERYEFEIWVIDNTTGQFVEATDQSEYTTNFNIDKNVYHSGRGWDSTLWQKVYVEGVPDYVLVAELNSVIPTFGVTIDAPTEIPQPPHFDDTHTNIFYDIHLQPQWGVRVKKADNNKFSDEVGDFITQEFEKDNTPITGLQVTPNTPLNIYYNKAGFNPKEISFISDAELKDEISFKPTGISGRWYNDHDTNESNVVKKAQDTYEMSVLLPSLGNSISQMWDMVYGNYEMNGNTKTRNTDINWDSLNGLRLVTTDDTGYNYYPEQVNTLAGCINSVHDLMGMIIVVNDGTVEEANKNIGLYDENKIYYFTEDKTFRRKAPFYEFDKVINYEFERVYPTEDTYKPNMYYISNNLNAPDTSGIFNSNTTYYAKKLNTNDSGFSKVDSDGLLQDYEVNTYYNQEGVNYYLATEQYQSNLDYFSLNINNVTDKIEKEYAPNRYSYKENVIIDGVSAVQYIIDTNPTKRDVDYFNVFLRGEEAYRYAPELYFYQTDDGGYSLDRSPNWTEGRTYYYQVPDPAAEEELIEITVLSSGDYCYYYDDNSNIVQVSKNDIKNNKKYYAECAVSGPITMYSPNTYYIIVNGNYILDESKTYDNAKEYFLINSINKVSPFYEGGKYYYQNTDGEYVIDNNNKVTTNRIYYIKDFYQIIEDRENIFDKGAVWNPNVNVVPASIDLGIRKEPLFYMEALKEFSRQYNTIHGLILRINKILLDEDDMTRDTSTVQGCINTVNDIIDKFDTLIPGRINIVDYLGRVSSANYQTDDWINMEVDNVNKMITVNHEYNPSANDTHELNLNDENQGDSVSFYVPKVDEKGHVVGTDVTRTTLPYSFKYINIIPHEGSSSIIEADNTKDSFSITSNNEWIEIDCDDENHNINIQHKIREEIIETVPIFIDFDSDRLTNSNDTFKFYEYYYDDAGHEIKQQPYSVKLPKGFSTISIKNDGKNSGAITGLEADGVLLSNDLKDGFVIKNENRWISLKASNATDHVVSIGHAAAGEVKDGGLIGPDTEKSPLFGESFIVPQVGIDVAGHVSSLIGRKINLPNLTRAESMTSGNVLTGLEVSSSGTIREKKSYLGNLNLATYDPINDTSEFSSIVQGDTVNKAFGKLQAQITKNAGVISTLGTDLTSVKDRIEILENVSITSTDSSETLTGISEILTSLLDRIILLENNNSTSTE